MIERGYESKLLDHGFLRVVDWMGTDERIAESARISYKSPSKGVEQDEKLIHYLWKHSHLSPFEQCNITLNIKMPIFIMRQFVRHRTFRINEVSARYTELPAEFYIPNTWRKQDIKNKQGSDGEFSDSQNQNYSWDLSVICDKAYNHYQTMINDGVSREMARMVLPVNIYTEIYVNCDLRNLLNFVRLREDSHAQYEIQVYSKAIKSVLEELYPMTMRAYEKYKFQMIENG
jgi:thymidylate synthase (FAD)